METRNKNQVDPYVIDAAIELNFTSQKDALVRAANSGMFHVVAHLLKKSYTKVDVRGMYDRTALMYAVNDSSGLRIQDYINTIKILLQFGADVNATDQDGKTALMYATKAKNYGIADLLIQSGSKINVTDKSGDTPLIYATTYSSKNINTYLFIESLIKAGANINIVNKDGKTPLMLIKDEGYQFCKLFIKNGANKNDLFCNGETELMYAVIWNDFKLLEKLILNKININAQDNAGKTALMLAAQDNIEMVNTLFKKGADIDIKDNNGKSALLYASSGIKGNIVKFLVELGANVNVITKDGQTVLLNLVQYLDIENIKLVLGKMNTLTINAKSEPVIWYDGHTAISLITDKISENECSDKYRHIVILLLKSQADPFIVCNGITAFYPLQEFARRKCDNELNQLLEAAKKNHTSKAPMDSHRISPLRVNNLFPPVSDVSVTSGCVAKSPSKTSYNLSRNY